MVTGRFDTNSSGEIAQKITSSIAPCEQENILGEDFSFFNPSTGNNLQVD